MFRFTALLAASSLLLFSTLRAQDCSEMFEFFREGAMLEYTHYDKKGKPETIHTHHITRLEQSKDTLIAYTEVTIIQAKNNKETAKYTVPIKCCKETLFFNMRSITPPVEAGQSPDIQMEFSGTDLSYPRNLRVGQTLPDSEMEMVARMGSLQLMKNRYVIKNRRVEAEESVTTSGGTFKCYKIAYDFEFQLLGTRTSRNEVWYAPAVGTVKSVSYDNKGREESRMELTKFSKK